MHIYVFGKKRIFPQLENNVMKIIRNFLVQI
jgi:hypothetical protein